MQDDAGSQLALSMMLFGGNGVARDDKVALGWMQKAAGGGYPPAQYALALHNQATRELSRQAADAIALSARAAAQGNAQAQAEMGARYLNGKGVMQNYQQALRLYHASAAQKYVPARVAMGDIYMGGKAVPRNAEQAIKWWSLAADQGDRTARVQIAMQFFGDEAGGYEKARTLLIKEGAASLKRARYLLETLYAQPEAPYHDEAAAFDRYLKGAQGGDEDAMYDVGKRYTLGIGTAPDAAQGLKWIRQSGYGSAHNARAN